MNIELRKELLDLAGYKHHPTGIVITPEGSKVGIKWYWTDPNGEGVNSPPFFILDNEVNKYLLDYLTITKLQVIMVLTDKGEWSVHLEDIKLFKDYPTHTDTNYCDAVAKMKLEYANA